DGIRDYKVTGVQTCALPISITPEMASSLVMPLVPLHCPYTPDPPSVVLRTLRVASNASEVIEVCADPALLPVPVPPLPSSTSGQIGRASCREGAVHRRGYLC